MKIAVVGLGLIGGSMAFDLKKAGFASEVIGVDKKKENTLRALERGFVDRVMPLEQAVRTAQVVILSTPVDVIVKILPEILDYVDNQVITEVGSTKKQIMASVEHHPKRSRFLSSHPMAGTEHSGPNAAVYGLFRGKCNVILDIENSDVDVQQTILEMYEKLGMRNVFYHSEEHDLHTAYVSHISHISSFALALTVLSKEKEHDRIFELASGGFGSTVRLAKSSPDMWVPIFEQNRDNVLDVLDEHINQLAHFRSLLIKKDFKTFYKLIEQSNNIKKILK